MATESKGEPAASGPTIPGDLPADPMPLVVEWLEYARRRGTQPNPDAMALATVDADGSPSVRMVLCRGVEPRAGYVVFYTNYAGRKGVALGANPRAGVCFHWDALDRQVMLEGPVTRSPAGESDAYFASRALLSRVGAWASDQSRAIASRGDLEAKFRAARERFGIGEAAAEAVAVPRPGHWGGYRLWVSRAELWEGRADRLHDRAEWARELAPGEVDGVAGFVGAGAWRATRLQP